MSGGLIFSNNASRESNLSKTYIPIHRLRIFRIERAPSTTHFKQQHSQGPEIDEFGISGIVEEDFGSEVFGRAAECVCELVGR